MFFTGLSSQRNERFDTPKDCHQMLGHEADEVCFCSDWLPAFPRSDSAASAGHFGLGATYFSHQLTFRSEVKHSQEVVFDSRGPVYYSLTDGLILHIFATEVLHALNLLFFVFEFCCIIVMRFSKLTKGLFGG